MLKDQHKIGRSLSLSDETWISAQRPNVGASILFFPGHDINDAVFPLVKNDLPVIKRGLLENPPCVVDFPRDTSFSRGFPS